MTLIQVRERRGDNQEEAAPKFSFRVSVEEALLRELCQGIFAEERFVSRSALIATQRALVLRRIIVTNGRKCSSSSSPPSSIREDDTAGEKLMKTEKKEWRKPPLSSALKARPLRFWFGRPAGPRQRRIFYAAEHSRRALLRTRSQLEESDGSYDRPMGRCREKEIFLC